VTRAPAIAPAAPAPLRPAQTGRGHRLDILIDISRAIGTIRDRRELMLAIIHHVTQAFGAERSTLYLHDPSRCELWTLVAQGLEHWPGELRIADDYGLCGRVFQTHDALCVDDTFETPHFARHLAERTGYLPRSMLLAPVIDKGGRCDGVLQVMDRRVGFFTRQDLPLLEAIAVQVGIRLENSRLYEAQRRQFNSFVRAFSAALDARDPLTAIHSVNVANYAMGIGEILGLPHADIEWLRIAGLLHDVGKIGVPEAVLTKPGRLTPDEFDEMKRHALYSREILSKIEFTEDLRGLEAIAAAHHEKLDGSGYPDGLSGDQIPLKARILTVADIYDALTQTRHYRQGRTMDEALRIIDEMTPAQLDARCVGALKAFLGRGPWPLP
jgi:putative nucleotidyltransferase with HDIG domain